MKRYVIPFKQKKKKFVPDICDKQVFHYFRTAIINKSWVN